MTTLHQSLSASLRNEVLEEAAKVADLYAFRARVKQAEGVRTSAVEYCGYLANAIRSLKTEE